MERLTDTRVGYTKLQDNADIDEVVEKLGQLEDIEEKLNMSVEDMASLLEMFRIFLVEEKPTNYYENIESKTLTSFFYGIKGLDEEKLKSLLTKWVIENIDKNTVRKWLKEEDKKNRITLHYENYSCYPGFENEQDYAKTLEDAVSKALKDNPGYKVIRRQHQSGYDCHEDFTITLEKE